ncbi:hypothetical protein [Prosthecomicrobium pneumaticum]|uniref:Uncharacterized protein n=1 Tax=Prosthecomicrobium pneumaticum TaxID=81895 RepID=A0A7W9L423_9HYPH|nr:hypothetical protein [Prosthecomicrobium pneumaticum]MBB5755136.1 hypothetical protein [Prosthecomicrobium pneumaticum]
MSVAAQQEGPATAATVPGRGSDAPHEDRHMNGSDRITAPTPPTSRSGCMSANELAIVYSACRAAAELLTPWLSAPALRAGGGDAQDILDRFIVALDRQADAAADLLRRVTWQGDGAQEVRLRILLQQAIDNGEVAGNFGEFAAEFAAKIGEGRA